MSASAYFQHTVAGPVIFAGVGLHTGSARARRACGPPRSTRASSSCAPTSTTLDNRVPVRPDAVCQTQLGTVINNAAGVTHLDRRAPDRRPGRPWRIDNCVVELGRARVPIMDGSAEPFVKIIDRAGRRTPGRAAPLHRDPRDHRGRATATSAPACRPPATRLRGRLRDRLPPARPSAASASTWPSTRRRSAANCASGRTFGFVHEVEALRAMWSGPRRPRWRTPW